LETRLLVKQQKEWAGYTYLWNDEQTDATLLDGAGRDQEFAIRDRTVSAGIRTQMWHFPGRTECMVCHSRAANFVLGLTEAQMNRTHQDGENQLTRLERLGLLQVKWVDYERHAGRGSLDRLAQVRGEREGWLSPLLPRPAEALRKLAEPSSDGPLEPRARSYLQANCAHCHVEAGGGNAMIDLEFLTSKENMRVFGVRPFHDTYGLPEAKLIAPGLPESSVLLHRISHRGPGHMPPLATTVVDKQAIDLLTAWIRNLGRQ
jgi:hypothetical protein